MIYIQVEQWCEHNFPSFVNIPQTAGNPATFDPEDARTTIYQKEQKIDQEISKRKRIAHLKNKTTATGTNGRATSAAQDSIPWEVLAFAGAAFVLIIALTVGIVFVALKYSDDYYANP